VQEQGEVDEGILTITLVAHAAGTLGGMERQLGELISGVLAAGHQVILVGRECGVLPHPRFRFVRVAGPTRPFSIAYPLFFMLGSLAVHRHRRGLLHTTGAIVFNRADLSTVHFCHRAFRASTRVSRTDRRELLYRLNARVAPLQSRLAEFVCYRPSMTRRLVGVSQGVSRELERYFPEMAGRVSTVPNAVDREAFAPNAAMRSRVRSDRGVASGELVALFVGGEWERKGLEPVIQALAAAPTWKLWVVGTGDEYRFRAIARTSGVASRVAFLGSQPDPAPCYAGADAFVLPSAYETFSLATYEAAAAGLPLLVSRVNGVEELLVDGENGWFIAREAHVIAERLQTLQAQPVLRERMGRRARDASLPNQWPAVVQAYIDLYRQLDRGVKR
jgi:glycosyltransferase involved in cell wall biosynthesis